VAADAASFRALSAVRMAERDHAGVPPWAAAYPLTGLAAVAASRGDGVMAEGLLRAVADGDAAAVAAEGGAAAVAASYDEEDLPIYSKVLALSDVSGGRPRWKEKGPPGGDTPAGRRLPPGGRTHREEAPTRTRPPSGRGLRRDGAPTWRAHPLGGRSHREGAPLGRAHPPGGRTPREGSPIVRAHPRCKRAVG